MKEFICTDGEPCRFPARSTYPTRCTRCGRPFSWNASDVMDPDEALPWEVIVARIRAEMDQVRAVIEQIRTEVQA